MNAYETLRKLPAHLRAVRIKHHFTRLGLAKAMGYSDETLYQWETGSQEPSLLALACMAEVLGVSIMDLVNVGEEDEKNAEGSRPAERVSGAQMVELHSGPAVRDAVSAKLQRVRRGRDARSQRL